MGGLGNLRLIIPESYFSPSTNTNTQIYTQLNVVQLQDKLVETLSGGERKRLGLASALVRKPDVLLMDEPSNHMDIDAIEWLEQYLQQRAITAIVVTHDRYFLQAVCRSEIWELEEAQLYRHTGDYEQFLESKSMCVRAAIFFACTT